MKKILYVALFILGLIELNAHGACLVDQLKLQKTCTGGAAPLTQSPEAKETYQSQETIKNIYEAPENKLGIPADLPRTDRSGNINPRR